MKIDYVALGGWWKELLILEGVHSIMCGGLCHIRRVMERIPFILAGVCSGMRGGLCRIGRVVERTPFI